MLEPILLDLAILFAACAGVAVVFHRMRLPPIVGFLVVGAFMGPHSLALVRHEHLVEQLAEIGVVVLLFTVGLELPLRQLARMRRAILLGGGVQVVGTIALGAGVALASGMSAGQAVFLGMLLSLSSTAAVTKLLSDRGEFSAPHGRLGVSLCVAQDLAVVPMILLIPLLAGSQEGGGVVLWSTLRSMAVLGVAAVAAVLLVPRVLDLVSRTRSREVFLLTVITLCLAFAVVTAELGMSMALGAFLAGMVLAESDYHHQAMADVEPFRDALASLFFVSIGMLFDYRVIVEMPGTVALALLAVVAGKAVLVFLAARTVRLPSWVGLRTALTLAQVGEFSFVLLQVSRGTGLFGEGLGKIFPVVAVLSIAATPLLYALGQRLAMRSRSAGKSAGAAVTAQRQDHVVIVGFGPVGQAMARVLSALQIPFVAVEMNAATVKAQKARGTPIFLGDSTRSAVLHAAGIEQARLLVIAVNDAEATRRTAAHALQLAPHVHVMARATYLAEVPHLQAAGVHEVVPQELETSAEMVALALRRYLVPDDVVGQQVHALRREAFGIEKVAEPAKPESPRISEFVPGVGVEVFQVAADAEVAGMTLAEAHIRRRSGCTVVAVRSGERVVVIVGPDTKLNQDDVVVVLGPRERLADAAALFHEREVHAEPESEAHEAAE